MTIAQPGTLRVRVIKCIDLNNKDWTSKNDAFVEVYTGNMKQTAARTVFVRDNNSPEFNQELDVPFEHDSTLHLDVMDKDSFGKSKLIGKAKFEFKNFRDQVGHSTGVLTQKLYASLVDFTANGEIMFEVTVVKTHH